ncbi:MAG TPA: ABC transporter permease [Candidatus Acidoferrales bacterium]
MANSPESFSQRAMRGLLRALPTDFRENFGGEMERVFDEQKRDAEKRGRFGDFARLWWETLGGIFRTAPREHWEILKQDVAYALRMLQKSPGFAITAILTLALGIGANTAIFSVVNSVLLRPLPYPQAQQLIFVREKALKVGADHVTFSVPEIEDYRARNHTLAQLAEYHGMSFTLFGHGDPERVRTGVVSANFFDMFGIQPLLGRTFEPGDDQPGAPPVVVLTYDYWKNSFGGDPAIIGKTFEMNDKLHSVVGVLPPVPQYPDKLELYMPTSACPFRSSKMHVENRDMRMMDVFARVKPGVTIEQARADMAAIAGHLQAEYPKSYPENLGFTADASPLQLELTHSARPTLLILLAAAAFVLLIACANVANLTLARMARRERELSVRTALGAGRSRLLRQLLTESAILALAGGGLGLFLAYESLHLLTQFASRLTPRAHEIRIDAGVLLFALAAALGTSLIFGTVSALFARANLTTGLKEGSSGAGSGLRRNRMRSALIVSQVAFSFMLLIGAGLLIRSLVKMQEVNPGFVPQRVLAMKINFNWAKYKGNDPFADVAKKVLDAVQVEPGVLSAAISSGYPLEPELISNGPNSNTFQIQGHPLPPGETPPITGVASTSPDYFKTLGIPLLAGRTFADTDDAAALPVLVISERLKKSLWPNSDPLGQKLSFDEGEHWSTIVGVVGDVREFGLDHAPENEMYAPIAQTSNVGTLILRTAMEPAGIMRRVREVIHHVDSQTAITQEMTIEQARRESLESPRLTATLLGLFAGLALLIAAAGIGGIMALAVSQRVHEIGIRMALGARRENILGMVLGQGALLAGLGIAIGAAGALALTALIKSLLFQVTPSDPLTFVSVAAVLIATAVLATYVPARRAARIDPMQALRSE